MTARFSTEFDKKWAVIDAPAKILCSGLLAASSDNHQFANQGENHAFNC